MKLPRKLTSLGLLALFAQTAQAQEPTGTGAGGGLFSLLPIILMFAAMYFLLIAPQRKRQKQEEAMREALKQGDRVVTVGGIYGTVSSLKGGRVTLKVAENTRIEFSKTSIAALVDTPDTEPGDSK